VEINPFPFEWRGERECEADPARFPGSYSVEYGGPRTIDQADLIKIGAEYPLLAKIENAGPNFVSADQVQALADEFERASQDERFGRPWRLGLAARLLRRFAGRVAEIRVPGV
jgi:hypothetical protein